MEGGIGRETMGATLRGKSEGSNDGATVPLLRTHFTSPSARRTAEEARDGERKGVAEGFIALAHEVRLGVT